jgi:hypothetical protein
VKLTTQLHLVPQLIRGAVLSTRPSVLMRCAELIIGTFLRFNIFGEEPNICTATPRHSVLDSVPTYRIN